MPDFQGACSSGCGDNVDLSDVFNAITEVTAHELIEAITDADVSLADSGQARLSWYDNTNGEIGDICGTQYGTVAGYRVQAGWSNSAGACITQPPARNEFTFAIPSALTLKLGKTANVLMRTTLVSGRASNAAIVASALPAGVRLSAMSVLEGTSANLVFSASTLARPGQYRITITAIGPASRHSAALLLTIVR
jgi:hypothetical protein